MTRAKLRMRHIRIGRRNIPAQLLLYLLVGVLSLCADFIVFLTLLPIGLVLAVIAGFVVGTIANYIFSKVLAFASGRFGRAHELFRLFCVALIGIGLTLGIVLALSSLGLSAVLAKLVATVAVSDGIFWDGVTLSFTRKCLSAAGRSLTGRSRSWTRIYVKAIPDLGSRNRTRRLDRSIAPARKISRRLSPDARSHSCNSPHLACSNHAPPATSDPGADHS